MSCVLFHVRTTESLASSHMRIGAYASNIRLCMAHKRGGCSGDALPFMVESVPSKCLLDLPPCVYSK